ncbi:hypothetical protein STRAU_0169 [Streptomyces aurantiacus JA 4570]|uniref:Uncharacterized protein n=1 Tax=Streptomyces aurantiacus JA 4570 TaxID=1286094 RepID=S3ZTJ3_9ACTN|nr:hypothetical protein STRAU_0169 [Streptomyces aurantiacus JA 4570]
MRCGSSGGAVPVFPKARFRGMPPGERPLSTFSRRDARSLGTRCQRQPGAL